MELKIQFGSLSIKTKVDEDQGEGAERREPDERWTIREAEEKNQEIPMNQQQKWDFWWETLGRTGYQEEKEWATV